jgi:transposase InsO family protein
VDIQAIVLGVLQEGSEIQDARFRTLSVASRSQVASSSAWTRIVVSYPPSASLSAWLTASRQRIPQEATPARASRRHTEHVSTTANHPDAIETVEQAIAESERLSGRPLAELLVDPLTGEIRPIALVTDNGPCFKSVRFAAYIERRPELIHIRTRRKSPNQNGVRERAFGSLKYEHLYRLEIDDGHTLGLEVETYRQLFNQVRPHEGIAMRRPLDVHLEAITDPQTTKSNESETLPTP